MENLRSARAALGKSQSQFASMLGISLRALQSYEQGWRPTPDHIHKLSAVLLGIVQCKHKDAMPKCWEVRHCSLECYTKCAAHDLQAGNFCWLVTGHCCQGEKLDSWEEKWKKCRRCKMTKM